MIIYIHIRIKMHAETQFICVCCIKVPSLTTDDIGEREGERDRMRMIMRMREREIGKINGLVQEKRQTLLSSLFPSSTGSSESQANGHVHLRNGGRWSSVMGHLIITPPVMVFQLAMVFSLVH